MRRGAVAIPPDAIEAADIKTGDVVEFVLLRVHKREFANHPKDP